MLKVRSPKSSCLSSWVFFPIDSSSWSYREAQIDQVYYVGSKSSWLVVADFSLGWYSNPITIIMTYFIYLQTKRFTVFHLFSLLFKYRSLLIVSNHVSIIGSDSLPTLVISRSFLCYEVHLATVIRRLLTPKYDTMCDTDYLRSHQVRAAMSAVLQKFLSFRSAISLGIQAWSLLTKFASEY